MRILTAAQRLNHILDAADANPTVHANLLQALNNTGQRRHAAVDELMKSASFEQAVDGRRGEDTYTTTEDGAAAHAAQFADDYPVLDDRPTRAELADDGAWRGRS